ncbi:biotin/lipoyl-binding protein, partial [bacterium]|nr:biotin/lipoyl-binding protein [bacterium]
MHSRARIVIPILVIIIAILVVFNFFSDNTDPNRLIISGNIEITDAQLSFQVRGTVIERPVNEGDSVTEGQLIARLDSTDQELLVAQAGANVDYVEAVLAELNAGTRPEDIQRAGAQVEQARAQLADLLSGSRVQEIIDAEAALERAQAG